MDILWNLQTLIISCSDFDGSVMPTQVWKCSHIRHIEFEGYKYVSLPDPPAGDGVILENLATLKGVRNLEFGEEVVKRIPNIKKLFIVYEGVVNKGSKGGDDPYCFSSIECLSKLESLCIDCYDYEGEIACLQNNLSFPHSIKRLNLSVRRDFEWKLDVLEKIGSLPLLEMLQLSWGWLEEGKWEIGEGQFPSLKYLELASLSCLESLSIDCGDYEGEIAYLQNNLSFPHSIKKLVLNVRSDLEWKLEVLEEIGSLPLLESLILERGCFEEGKWEIGEGQFPSLKYLQLARIHNLEELAAEEGSSIIFPCLQYLDLYGLEELKEMSSEIGNIPTLQKIQMEWCNELGVKCMKEIVEEQVELQGDPLPFHVEVRLNWNDQHLMSLAGPNFEVRGYGGW